MYLKLPFCYVIFYDHSTLTYEEYFLFRYSFFYQFVLYMYKIFIIFLLAENNFKDNLYYCYINCLFSVLWNFPKITVAVVTLSHIVVSDSEEEVNFIDHSKYYNDQDYKDCLSRSKGALRILKLNCGRLNAKLDNLKIFLADCNNIPFPIHVITLQEIHINSNADIPYFELPGYTLVYDLARINSFGGVAIYGHDSFSFTRLDIDTFKQTSSVYESMYLKIYNKDASFHKYVIGSVY